MKSVSGASRSGVPTASLCVSRAGWMPCSWTWVFRPSTVRTAVARCRAFRTFWATIDRSEPWRPTICSKKDSAILVFADSRTCGGPRIGGGSLPSVFPSGISESMCIHPRPGYRGRRSRISWRNGSGRFPSRAPYLPAPTTAAASCPKPASVPESRFRKRLPCWAWTTTSSSAILPRRRYQASCSMPKKPATMPRRFCTA